MAVLGTTTCWSPGEVSLRRSSFNNIVNQPRLAGRRFDMPEGIMREKSMGRQAEFGSTWTPPGIHARRMADTITSRMSGSVRQVPTKPPSHLRLEGTSFSQHQATQPFQSRRPQSAPLAQSRSTPNFDARNAEARDKHNSISKMSLLMPQSTSAESTTILDASGTLLGGGTAGTPTPVSSVPNSARGGSGHAASLRPGSAHRLALGEVLAAPPASALSSVRSGDTFMGATLRPKSAPVGRNGRPQMVAVPTAWTHAGNQPHAQVGRLAEIGSVW